jgi:hypothetical protein
MSANGFMQAPKDPFNFGGDFLVAATQDPPLQLSKNVTELSTEEIAKSQLNTA